MRHNGPLTYTSAFRFENFYGEIRNSFVPGTNSTLKQIMQKFMLKRTLIHSCSPPIFISPKDTALECNSLVYTFENEAYKIYKVTDTRKNMLKCQTIGKLPATFKEIPALNWSSIGVFRNGGLSNNTVLLPSKKSPRKSTQSRKISNNLSKKYIIREITSTNKYVSFCVLITHISIYY